MKKKLLAGLAFGLLMSAGMANADTLFDISDITFSNLIGDAEAFTWEVKSELSIDDFWLAPGASHEFTFGSFKPTNESSSLVSDADDEFTVSFKVNPPDSILSGTGEVSATFKQKGQHKLESYNVDYGSTLTVLFGNGGSYDLTFSGLNDITDNGWKDLTATIKLVHQV